MGPKVTLNLAGWAKLALSTVSSLWRYQMEMKWLKLKTGIEITGYVEPGREVVALDV